MAKVDDKKVNDKKVNDKKGISTIALADFVIIELIIKQSKSGIITNTNDNEIPPENITMTVYSVWPEVKWDIKVGDEVFVDSKTMTMTSPIYVKEAEEDKRFFVMKESNLPVVYKKS